MSEYAPLNQEEGSDSKELILKAAAPTPFWASPTAIAILLVMLLLVNVTCLVFTTHQVDVVYETLKDRLEFVANHDLRQPRVRYCMFAAPLAANHLASLCKQALSRSSQ